MSRDRRSGLDGALVLIVGLALGATLLPGARALADDAPSPLLRQTRAESDAKSSGCLTCHVGIEPMHETGTVKLGCTDCHGGDAKPSPGSAARGSAEYQAAMAAAHVAPRYPDKWGAKNDSGEISSANPIRSYTLLNHESPEFIRFFNPGDLRIASETCGVNGCLRIRSRKSTAGRPSRRSAAPRTHAVGP